MKKILALFGALALIICVSSCGNGYNKEKVDKILTQLQNGEIDDDVETTTILAKEYVKYDEQYTKERIKIAKKSSTFEEYNKEVSKLDEKYSNSKELFKYLYNHKSDIPEELADKIFYKTADDDELIKLVQQLYYRSHE